MILKLFLFQARLKAVFREKETVDTQLAALKKELHMKDIYLKQLGAHNVVNAVPVDQDHLQQMNGKRLFEKIEEFIVFLLYFVLKLLDYLLLFYSQMGVL